MGETEKEFRARLTYLLVVHGGCRDVSMSWGPMSTCSDGSTSSVVLRFKDRVGLEQSTTFDWPPARGAVDRILSQVVGYEVYVHGMEIHASPAAPNVDPPLVGYPTIDGFIAQCETCDEPAQPFTNEHKPTPWRRGLCPGCQEKRRAALLKTARRRPPVATLPLEQAQVTLQDYLAFLRDRCHELEQALDAERAAAVDLKEKLADLRLRAVANSKVAGVMVPGRKLREPYVPSIDDVDLLPDA